MISNPAIPHPAMGPHQFTLNDLRVHSFAPVEESSNFSLRVSGMVLVAVVAIGAFVMLDPLALFALKIAVAPTFAPPADPERPATATEVITPQLILPATKSIEEPPVAPAVVQAVRVPAPAARQRSGGGTAPASATNPRGKADTAALRAIALERRAPPVLLSRPQETPVPPAALIIPEEKAPPPLLLTKPEENPAPPVFLTKPEAKPDVPMVPNRGDDLKDAPKSAATNDQPPVKEEVN